MSKIAGIYKITSPSGAVYIGQSTDIGRRWRAYWNYRCKAQTRIYRSMCKYGGKNHIYEVIHELPPDVSISTLHEYEKLYIEQHKSCGFEMLNLNDGGTGGPLSNETKQKISAAHMGIKTRLGTKHSEESKMKISAGRKGKRIPQAGIDSMKQKLKGRTFDDDWKKKLSAWQIGRKLTDEHKEKVRQANIGKKASEETKAKMRASQQKRRAQER